MSKNELLLNYKVYLEENIIKAKLYYVTAEKLMETYDNVEMISKDDVKDFLFNGTSTKKTFNIYKAHLNAFFDYCVETGIRTTNPARELEGIELINVREEVGEKMKLISHDEIMDLINRLVQDGNLILAAIIASYYEGLSTSEIAMIEKEDIHEDYVILKQRNGYRFHLNEYHSKILHAAMNATSVTVYYPTVGTYRSYPLQETKYLARFNMKSKIKTELKERCKQVLNCFGNNLNFEYSVSDIYASGMMYYIRNEVDTRDDLTEQKIKYILSRYNTTWHESYEMIKREF